MLSGAKLGKNNVHLSYGRRRGSGRGKITKKHGMKKSVFLAAAVAVVTVGLAGCASQRNVALPQDVTYVILSIGSRDTDRDGRPDVTFAKNGQFFGSTGCNRYFGQYITEGQDIEIAGTVGMTRMYCHNKAEQEQLLAREIVKVKKFEVKGNRLVLTTSDGLKIEGVRAK